MSRGGFRCDECAAEVRFQPGERTRIWPRLCPACMRARQAEKEQAPYVDVFPESMTGYNIQIDRVIRGRKHLQEVIREVRETTRGKVELDWH